MFRWSKCLEIDRRIIERVSISVMNYISPRQWAIMALPYNHRPFSPFTVRDFDPAALVVPAPVKSYGFASNRQNIFASRARFIAIKAFSMAKSALPALRLWKPFPWDFFLTLQTESRRKLL
jgi:hypothetical protein